MLSRLTFRRLIGCELCDAIALHRLENIGHIGSYIRVAVLAPPYEWHLQQSTVFWPITFLLDKALNWKGNMINRELSLRFPCSCLPSIDKLNELLGELHTIVGGVQTRGIALHNLPEWNEREKYYNNELSYPFFCAYLAQLLEH